MARKSRQFAIARCECGKKHFLCFPSEMIVCKCLELTEVAGDRYATLDPDERRQFLQDVRGWVEDYADNTSKPPRFDNSESSL